MNKFILYCLYLCIFIFSLISLVHGTEQKYDFCYPYYGSYGSGSYNIDILGFNYFNKSDIIRGDYIISFSDNSDYVDVILNGKILELSFSSFIDNGSMKGFVVSKDYVLKVNEIGITGGDINNLSALIAFCGYLNDGYDTQDITNPRLAILSLYIFLLGLIFFLLRRI